MNTEENLPHPISVVEVQENHYKDDHDYKPGLWDCESQLYDSYELRTFKKQLNAAMVALNSGLTSPYSIIQSPVYGRSLASFLVKARGDKSRRTAQLQGRIKGHDEQKRRTENGLKNDDKMVTVWSRKAPKEEEVFTAKCKQEGSKKNGKKKPVFVKLAKKVIKSFENLKAN